jgi:hypothetical protein
MKTSGILASCALATAVATAHGQTLADGDFNAIATGNYAPSSSLGAWFVDGNQSGVIVSNFGIGGTNCVVFEDVYDTDPTSSTITQTVTGLIPGQTYLIEFYTSGFSGFLSPDTGVPVNVSVSVNGAPTLFSYASYYSNGDAPGMGSNPWVYRSVQFIANDTSEEIIFSGSNPGYSASIIDSVSIAAIPEFSASSTVFGLAALCVFSLRRSRKTPARAQGT